MTKRLVCIAAFTVALSGAPDAQTAVSSTDLQAAVTKLAMAVASVPEGVRTPRLASAVQWLQNNAGKSRVEDISPEYVRALDRAATVLSKSPGTEAVEDVTRELEVKVDHCRRLGVGMGGSVLLKVNTRRGARVVADLQVLYLLKFDEWLKTSPRNFLRVSSPTEMNLEPGRYWLWARDPATGSTSDRVLVEVAGTKAQDIDLPVP